MVAVVNYSTVEHNYMLLVFALCTTMVAAGNAFVVEYSYTLPVFTAVYNCTYIFFTGMQNFGGIR